MNTAANETDQTPRSWPRRVRFAVLYSAYLVVLCWIGLKVFAWMQYDVPVTRSANADDVWRLYYAELWKSGVLDSNGSHDDGRFDVLLLGASVLEQVAPKLETALRKRYGESVRVYNLALSAHTTRDSANKYRRLRDRTFDLVIVYHGINDSRMNCCREEDYRDDYSHCAWYDSFERKLEAGAISFRGVTSNLNRGKIGLGPPDEENLRYSRNVKTGPAFRRNVEAILKLAAAKQTPVLLMTFASHLPADYSRAAFEAGRLDYGEGHHQLAVEVWGEPAGVKKAIATHNAVIRKLHRDHPQTIFVDMKTHLPESGRIFSDVCHLTPDGCDVFVSRMMPAIEERFPAGDY